MIRLGVSGALGKMGARVLSLASQDKDFRVILALERLSHPQIGEKIAGAEVVCDREMIKDIDCLVDFTAPEAALINIEYCLKFKKAIVVGTTGLLQEQKDRIDAASKKIPIVLSPNMSIGVNLLFQLVRDTAVRLPSDYKINITEAHHSHKKDAPSGTAKFLAQIVKEERIEADVDIKSIREGEIVGDHEVVFDSPWDTIKLSHSAKTRDIFAKGALEAARFLVKKKSGIYCMEDVLKKGKNGD